MDDLRSALDRSLLAQPVDVDLDEVGFAVEVCVPHVLDDFTPADHLRSPRKKKLEKGKFLGSQRDGLTGPADAAMMAVQFNVGVTQNGLAFSDATPDKRTHSGQQFS